MKVVIEIKPNKVSRFLGKTVGRVSKTVGAGVRGFKKEAAAEWKRTAPQPNRKTPNTAAVAA